jgi:MFS family permease
VVVFSVLLWGAAIAGFGLTPWLPLGLVLLAVAGAADVVSAVFRNTILQLSVPDGLRGRLSSIHIAVVTGGPALGDAEAGAVAALTTPRISVVSGGLACMLGVLLLVRWVPELSRYDAAVEVSPVGDADG